MSDNLYWEVWRSLNIGWGVFAPQYDVACRAELDGGCGVGVGGDNRARSGADWMVGFAGETAVTVGAGGPQVWRYQIIDRTAAGMSEFDAGGEKQYLRPQGRPEGRTIAPLGVCPVMSDHEERGV